MIGPVLAIDLGGTRVKVGVLADGVVHERAVVPAASHAGLVPSLPRVQEIAASLLGGAQPVAVGMAVPGIVDRSRGMLTAINAKWSDAIGLDLPAWARETWAAPLTLENDAVAALAGERMSGAAAGTDGAVLMTLGTGIGVAALVEGRLLRGTHGQAAIAGHLTVQVDGRPCSCGNEGCAEAEASTAMLPALAREDARFETSALARETPLDYRAVFALAATDPLSRDLRDRAIRVWSALAVSLVHAYDPEILVLGGGVADAGEALLAPIRDHLRRHAWTPWGTVAVVPAALGADAALVGMAALVAHGPSGAPDPQAAADAASSP